MNPAKHEDVRPAVAIEIMYVTEQRVGRARWQRKLFRRINLMRGFKVRSFVPKGAGHDVRLAVAIDVTSSDSIAIILAGKDLLLKRRWLSAGAGGRNRSDVAAGHDYIVEPHGLAILPILFRRVALVVSVVFEPEAIHLKIQVVA